jgi:hypothetical protein
LGFLSRDSARMSGLFTWSGSSSQQGDRNGNDTCLHGLCGHYIIGRMSTPAPVSPVSVLLLSNSFQILSKQMATWVKQVSLCLLQVLPPRPSKGGEGKGLGTSDWPDYHFW